ncbi:MAG: hypothetical protein K9I71_08635 [Ignavibacteriales bacterium]|nr:hypothetical protein [Ignavibacteriales bacterium]MCF8316178.1 hypothetical protein [Ignavibacteriales bacterium]MCF8436680.1 hypothetical protein [Ignavibacteriales bacterium]
MSDLENNKENGLIEFIEKTTSTINLDKATQNEHLSTILENNTEYDESTSKDIIDDISSTIDLIQDNFEDLQKAKDEGKSRTEWFKGKIDQTIEAYKIDDPKELISEIKEGLSESNTQIGVEVFGKEINISEPLLSTKYEDLNKTAIINNFQEEIKNNTLLGAIVFEKGSVKIDDTHKEIQAVKDYFNAKLDSPTDNAFKKAVSTATVIAQEKDLLPKQLKDKTPDEIAMIVDKGVTAAKVAYKLGNGELSPLDAVEYTIDRNVAVLNSAITRTCTRVGGAVGGKVGAAIGSIFGPAGTVAGAAIGTVVGKVGGYVVGKVIGEGVKKVANAVKSVCSAAWEGVKSVASSAWEGVKSFFSWW